MDRIVRAISKDGFVKIAGVTTKELTEKMRQMHRTLPLATAALGRTLAAASIMGDQLKEDEASLTLHINGGGPLGSITAVSDSSGNVRGYLQDANVTLPLKGPGKLDVGRGVGTNGLLTVFKDFGSGNPFRGSVELVSGEIAEDIAAYFVISEQIPTVCALGVLVDRDQSVMSAGGYLLQLLPGAPDEYVDLIEANVKRAGAVTDMLLKGDLETMLLTVMQGLDIDFLSNHPIEYRCNCSRERVEKALISMGREDLESIKDDDNVEICCQFCDKKYNFTPQDIEKIIERL